MEEAGKADAVAAHISEVAAETGTTLLKVRTNLREFTDRWVRWDLHQNGCAIAAVGLLLRPRLDRVWIPSSYGLPFLGPYGSHPGLDSLWSLPGFELGHDTLNEDRVDKLVALAGWALARRHLRVCWQPHCSGLNCGRCRKCLTTHACLRGFCGDHHWPTFPDALDLRALKRVRPNSQDMLARCFRLRDHLMTTGRDPQLLASVKGLLAHHQRRGPVVSLFQLVVRAHARLAS